MNLSFNSTFLQLLENSNAIGIAVCQLLRYEHQSKPQLRCLQVNEKFARCLNTTPEGLINQFLSNDVYDFNDIAQRPDINLVPLLIQGEESYKVDMIYDANISDCIIFLLHPVGDYIAFYKKHITEKAQAKFLSFTHQSIVPMMVSNLRDYTDYNESYVKYMGYESREELLKADPYSFSPKYQPNGELSSEKYKRYLQEAKENGISHFEWTHLRKDGTEAYAEVHVIYNMINGSPFINITLRDITETKKLEQQLREEQDRLINELSVPLIPLSKDIMLLPVIGTLNNQRATAAVEEALKSIAKHQSRVMIIDISGLNANHITSILMHLNKLAKGAGLMGCKAILSGISGKVAEAFVNSGISLTQVYTTNTLEAAFTQALSLVKLNINK